MGQGTHDFERQIATRRTGLASEFWGFLSQNKKWWLLPIIVVFMFVGVLLVLGGTAAAPFIYTLF
jgi:Family of unknown function (DUF5989)